jgi:hypothetical protein
VGTKAGSNLAKQILFGGAPVGGPRNPASRPIKELLKDPIYFDVGFDYWMAHVWFHERLEQFPTTSHGPQEIGELRGRFLDELNPAILPETLRGHTLEEACWYWDYIKRRPHWLLLAEPFGALATNRIARKEVLPTVVLIGLLHRRLRGAIHARYSALVSDGNMGHYISLRGIDEAAGWFQYWDVWPEQHPGAARSLLCLEHNRADVRASIDPSRKNLWLITAEELGRVLVGVHLEFPSWEAWRADWNHEVNELFSTGQIASPNRNLVYSTPLARLGVSRSPLEGWPNVVDLALQHLDRGSKETAIDLFKSAAASDHPDAAPIAASWLGMLLDAPNSLEQSRKYFRIAIDSKHYAQAPIAAMDLGFRLLRDKDSLGAIEAFRTATAYRHPDTAPAALCLAGMLGEQGSGEALDFCRLALEIGTEREQYDAALAFDHWIARLQPDAPPRQPIAASYLPGPLRADERAAQLGADG